MIHYLFLPFFLHGTRRLLTKRGNHPRKHRRPCFFVPLLVLFPPVSLGCVCGAAPLSPPELVISEGCQGYCERAGLAVNGVGRTDDGQWSLEGGGKLPPAVDVVAAKEDTGPP